MDNYYKILKLLHEIESKERNEEVTAIIDNIHMEARKLQTVIK